MQPGPGLAGRSVAITRPAGTAQALVRQLRAEGAMPLLLPGLSLRGLPPTPALLAAWRAALRAELLLFTSPAAVRHAARLAPLRTRATVLAVGQGTAAALRRQGVLALLVPARQDSEGLLELPALQELRGRQVALIGAEGGRGLLQQVLRERGARLREVHVYRRAPPRLNQRHLRSVLALSSDACVLLSSTEALQNLQALLSPPAWQALCAATAVVSSARLAAAAREAGFERIVIAASAGANELLSAARSA